MNPQAKSNDNIWWTGGLGDWWTRGLVNGDDANNYS